MSDSDITLKRRYATNRGRIFEAWTRPGHLRRWAFGGERRAPKSVRVDLFPGGRWELVLVDGPEGSKRCGTFREIHPPGHLVFTWTSNAPDVDGVATVVTVDIEDADSGVTVTLRHEGLPDGGCDARRQEWCRLLESLEGFLQGG